MRRNTIGDQLIRVPLDILQYLMSGNKTEISGWELPRSVDIVGVIPQDRDPFIPDPGVESVMIRIQHKYCFRRPKGSPLCIEDYSSFIERFKSLAKAESDGTL